MHEMWAALATAARLIATLDRDLVEIVLLSLKVNFGSVALASLIGLPLGAALALFSFVGRRTAIVIVSALMGLPPVVVGLVVYLLLSRAGPFGVFGLKRWTTNRGQATAAQTDHFQDTVGLLPPARLTGSPDFERMTTFSRTVRCGSSPKLWNTIAMRRFRSSRGAVSSNVMTS